MDVKDNAEIKEFKKLLKNHRQYVTKARLRLFILLQKHSALTINELISLLDKHDQATIYRNVKVFEKLGVISRLQLGWHSKLEMSDMFRHHHHHLTCIRCNRVIILREDPVIERQIAQLSRAKNFRPVDHQLEISGICAKCR